MVKPTPGEPNKAPDIEGLKPKATAREIRMETLAGDTRDVMLTHFRGMHLPWGHMNEQEQTDKIEALEKCARELVRRAVYMVAASDMPVLHVQLGKWTVDKGMIKREFTLAAILDNIRRMSEYGAISALLVLADPAVYMGEREAARADPDEPKFPFDKDTGEVRDDD